MARHGTTPANSFQQTLIFQHPGTAAAALPPEDKPGKRAELVFGSEPDFTHETDNLLRDRLRQAAIALSVCYVLLVAKQLLFPDLTLSGPRSAYFWSMAGVGAFTILIAQRLHANCQHALKHLRTVEAALFLASAVNMFLIGVAVLVAEKSGGKIAGLGMPWITLIFTYAMFIPNTWQRAATRILPFAFGPLATVLVAAWLSPELRTDLRAHSDFIAGMIQSQVMLGLGAGIAVWGVKTIRTLRAAAFQSRQLGQYRLKHKLGEGGMGEVYLAEHLMLKRPCAIKIIRPSRAGDPQALARFEKEVQSMARLTHWNNVEIFDYGRTDDGTFYYVMEYLPGMDLDELVQMHGPMPASRVIHLMIQVCDALAEAHAAGLIHRDLKPGNIFAAVRGGLTDVAKLLDFGLVKSVNQGGDVRLTQEKMVTGSPLYLSPEQAQGDPAHERSDLYSLGCVMYYLLTGRPPFEETHPVKLILAHAQQPPAPLSRHRPDIPADLESIVMKCLEKDPRDRFGSARELQDSLRDCRDAGVWTHRIADDWWQNFGCPRKKEIDRCVCEGVEYKSHMGGSVEESAESLIGA